MPIKGKNSFGIPYQRTGNPAQDALNWRVLDALDQLRIQPSTTASASTGPGGTIVHAAGGSRANWRSASGAAPFHLTGFIDDSGESPVAKITVAVGLVNNTIPTIGGVSLAAVVPPFITVTGASGEIWMRAHWVSGGIDTTSPTTALTITSLTAAPTDTTTDPVYKYKLIGTWTASGGAFTSVVSILNTNQTLRICRGAAEWY